ncbi:hypothetical protein GUJ93_ZPchr0002g26282 [Zizania palustris]|uniref:Uncharacterized protein n=1 Tax=Zizania palustris TaxID=103762 RepID=A0A8J5SBQ8_ZIZPA|nr:hypothetical protein GUJ93_ZPchr0002g26282 [Zizania palustris]
MDSGGGYYDGDGRGGTNANSLFGGGGFMPSQSTNATEGSSSGFPKTRNAQTLLPLTVKQIMDAFQTNEDMSDFTVNDMEVSTLCTDFKVIIRENDSADTKEMANVKNDDYVIVNGGLKCFQGKRQVVAYSVSEGPGAPFPGGATASLHDCHHRQWRLSEGAVALLPGGAVEALGLGHRPRRCRVDGGPAILFTAGAATDLGLGHRPRRCWVDGGSAILFPSGVVEDLGSGHRPRCSRVDDGPVVFFLGGMVAVLGSGHRPRRCRVDGSPTIPLRGAATVALGSTALRPGGVVMDLGPIALLPLVAWRRLRALPPSLLAVQRWI